MFLFGNIKKEVNDAATNCRKAWWIKSWWVKPYLYSILMIKNIWWYTPYKRALAIIAYLGYQKTFMYTERKKLFGHEEAEKMYIDNGEFKHFYWKLGWKHHLKAVFIPFNYLEGLQ